MSIKHLYGHVVLYSATGYGRFVSCMQHSEFHRHRVHTLQIGLNPLPDPLSGSAAEEAERHAWLSRLPIHLPKLLVNAKSLIFHDFPVLHSSFFSLVRQFTSIVTLHVWKGMLTATPGDLARMLWSLPSLQHAIFEGLNFMRVDRDPPKFWRQRRRLAPSLKSLAFSDCGLLWEEWMLAIEMSSLRTLVLVGAPIFPYDHEGDYEDPGLLLSTQQSLEELTIILKTQKDNQDPLRTFPC